MIKLLYLSTDARPKSDSEIDQILFALQSGALGDLVEVEERWDVRARSVPELVRSGPTILHFGGLGSEFGETLFEDPVQFGRALARAEGLRLVVLSASYSEPIAQLVGAQVEICIGVQGRVDPHPAQAFSAAFYAALSRGESARAAFDKATKGLSGFQMYTHPSVDADAWVLGEPPVPPLEVDANVEQAYAQQAVQQSVQQPIMGESFEHFAEAAVEAETPDMASEQAEMPDMASEQAEMPVFDELLDELAGREDPVNAAPNPERLEHGAAISAMALSPDGKRLATGTISGELAIWDLRGVRLRRAERNEAIGALAWDGDHSLMIGGEKLWHWELDGELVSMGGEGPLSAVLTLPGEGPPYYLAGSQGGALQLWGVDGPEDLIRWDTWINGLLLLPDGRVLVAREGREPQLWTMPEQGPNASMPLDPRPLVGYAGSPTALARAGEGQVVIGDRDGGLELWQLQPPRRLVRLEGHEGKVTSLARLSRRRVASGSEDGTVRVWDLEAELAVSTYAAHLDGVTALAALRDGRMASASADGSVRIWTPVQLEILPSSPVAGFLSDTARGEDQLDIADEVRALSEVVMAREVKPPLAIGLFGDWGSGKSFFMGMMRAKVREIANEAQLDELSVSLRELAICMHADADQRELLRRLADTNTSPRSTRDTNAARVQRHRIRALADALWLRHLYGALGLLAEVAGGELAASLSELRQGLAPQDDERAQWSALDGPALLACLHTQSGSAWRAQVQLSRVGEVLGITKPLEPERDPTLRAAEAFSRHIDELEVPPRSPAKGWVAKLASLRPELEQLFESPRVKARVVRLCQTLSDMVDHAEPGELREQLRKLVDELWLLGIRAHVRSAPKELQQFMRHALIAEEGRGSSLDDFTEVEQLLRVLASDPTYGERCVEALAPIRIGAPPKDPDVDPPALETELWLSIARRLDELADGRYDALFDEEGTSQPAARSPFYGNVVQIEFNAWHYAEANLWASLVTQIFDGLSRELSEGSDEKNGDARNAKHRRRLLAKLETARSLQVDAELDARTAERHAAALQRECNEAELAAERERNALREARRDALNESELIRRQLKEKLSTLLPSFSVDQAKRPLEEFFVAAGLERDTIHRLAEAGSELASVGGRMSAAARSMRREQSWSQRMLLPLFLGLLTMLVALLGQELAVLLKLTWGSSLSWAGGLAGAVGTTAAVLLKLVGPLERGLDIAAEARSLIKLGEQQLANDFAGEDAKADDISPETRERLADAEARLVAATAERSGALDRLEQARDKVREAERAVREAQAGRRFYRFIEARSESADYRQHLGLIHLIRQDFDKLQELISSYVRERRSADIHGVERIVLYIDDLDRCEEKRVVEILQAIHLLLAIPLFVVVVAVDSRWLLHALERQYPQFAESGRTRAITPQNYLEKIFQIPFEITPMKKDGFARLINSLAPVSESEEGVEERAEESPAKPPRSSPLAPAPSSPVRPAGSRTPLFAPPSATPSPVESESDARPAQASPASLQVPTTEQPTATAPSGEEPSPRVRTTSAPVLREPSVSNVSPASLIKARMSAREKLSFTRSENEALKALYPFVSTPRGTKRLVNVYRLLRVLDPPDGAISCADVAHSQYRGVLFLLAAQIGDPAGARELFADIAGGGVRDWKTLLRSKQRTTYRAVADSLELSGSLEPMLPWIEHVRRFSFDTGMILSEGLES